MSKERILFVHNSYQHKGGEDSVVDDEINLLRENGHDVFEYRVSNDKIKSMNKLDLLKTTIWSKYSTQDIKKINDKFSPDICHIHNTFPLISPSIYWELDKKNIPIVQTLHNFRLACPQAMFLRDGKICESCLGKIPLQGIVHGCYRDSIAQTAVLSSMLVTHRILGTWKNKVTYYIALNEFCKEKFISAGIPPEKIKIKPNFVIKTNQEQHAREDYFLYIGRLSKEKGISTLLEAFKNLPNKKLLVAGDGPEKSILMGHDNINCIGHVGKEQIIELLLKAKAIIIPSIWYENFPKIVVEAMAYGAPIIASNIGSLATIIEDNFNGLLFDPNNAESLTKKISFIEENENARLKIGKNALDTYEKLYSKQKNYSMLIDIYSDSIQKSSELNLK